MKKPKPSIPFYCNILNKRWSMSDTFGMTKILRYPTTYILCYCTLILCQRIDWQSQLPEIQTDDSSFTGAKMTDHITDYTGVTVPLFLSHGSCSTDLNFQNKGVCNLEHRLTASPPLREREIHNMNLGHFLSFSGFRGFIWVYLCVLISQQPRNPPTPSR